MKRRILLLWILALCLSELGCSRSPPPTSSSASGASSRPPRDVVVVVGSSTASGFGVADAAVTWVGRYAAYLAVAHPGLTVKNLAVPGFSTFQVLPTGSSHRWGTPRVDPAHNVTAALAEQPRALIVNLPSNDAALGFTVDETLTNLRAVVAEAKSAGVPTWVTTSQPRALDATGVALLVRMRDAVLEEFKARSLNFWAPLAAADGMPLPAYNQGDGIHPNAEGHRLLFEVVKAADVAGHLTPSAP